MLLIFSTNLINQPRWYRQTGKSARVHANGTSTYTSKSVKQPTTSRNKPLISSYRHNDCDEAGKTMNNERAIVYKKRATSMYLLVLCLSSYQATTT